MADPTSTADTLAALRELGLGLPEAWEDFPWGETALKVRKKVFAFLHRGVESGEDGVETSILHVTLKLPQSMADALERPDAKPSGYGLGRHGWVSLRLVEGTPLPALDELQAWMVESYRAVAPKTLARKLDVGA